MANIARLQAYLDAKPLVFEAPYKGDPLMRYKVAPEVAAAYLSGDRVPLPGLDFALSGDRSYGVMRLAPNYKLSHGIDLGTVVDGYGYRGYRLDDGTMAGQHSKDLYRKDPLDPEIPYLKFFSEAKPQAWETYEGRSAPMLTPNRDYFPVEAINRVPRWVDLEVSF